MSGGIAPSKSTVYISNFAFSLTNNDLHKIFEKYGKVVKVTIVKDQVTRKSKGVAFVLFLERDSAYQAVRALNNTQLFGRTIKCIIAKDNGRATEFIRKKTYPDKSRCYECGDEGHMSYKCPRNILGEREPPPKKTKKDKKREQEERGENFVDLSGESGSEEEGEDPKQDSLAAAIQFQQQKLSEEQVGQGSSRVLVSAEDFMEQPHRKRFKKDAYFSDEEEVDDGATGDT